MVGTLAKGILVAQKIQVLLTCDLHEEETPAVGTVAFGFDGHSYAFELCQEHLDEFNNAMQGYIAAARKGEPAGDGRRRRRPPASSAPDQARPPRATRATELGEIREWARANGYQVSSRGRVPGNVVEAYNAAVAG